MFYQSVTLSTIHLATMVVLAYRRTEAIYLFLVGGLPALFCVVMFSEVLLFQAIVLALLAILWRRLLPKYPSVFVAASFLAVVAIYSGISWHALSVHQNLLDHFPMESMTERAPEPKKRSPRPAEAGKSWSSFERELTGQLEMEEKRFWSRASYLKQLHEDTTKVFVSSPGFGVGRMRPRPSRPEQLELSQRADEPIPQPDMSQLHVFSAEDLERPFVPKNRDALSQLHFDGLMDFVNVAGFGYFKDRQQVAGFRSHGFSQMPNVPELRVERLELLSLLKHDGPVVYVSKDLPRMKELKNAPTRGLSDFELKGLAAIENGEDLFVREVPHGLLMLGAMRSVEQCVKCHGGESGDLLGAFSYSLENLAK
jgi:hypothetical protein